MESLKILVLAIIEAWLLLRIGYSFAKGAKAVEIFHRNWWLILIFLIVLIFFIK